MAKFVLKNVRLFAGGADLTTVNNQIALNAEAESKDTTAFVPTGDVWHEEVSGIKSVQLNASGQWEASDASKVDDEAFGSFGTINAVSAMPATAADGALAWLTAYNRRQYQLLGAVGDVAPWSWQAAGAWPLVRGQVLANPTARTATGTGTSVQLGAVSSALRLYVGLHVFSVSGTTPSLTVAIQGDNATGFPSPVTVGTFSAATAIGSQIMRVAGPITDDWFRVSYTISGTTPSFLFAVTAGIAV
jgi:hypothetical protein